MTARRSSWLWTAAALLLIAAPASAQSLERTVDRIAAAWQAGDAAAIASLAAGTGMAIDLDGGSAGPLGPRQAAAVLRRLFSAHETVSARPTMLRGVGGEPARAFGEITWIAMARGTSIPERTAFFLAFVYEGDRWRVTEIRLIR